ncbi:hypothetical protein NON00_19295 [Roseomonas sp. GC11]|uniref:hypothetical protein n=1 Tax=Roseomonas sp. GC11 TaxID=2950546 RepID=UPI00210D20F1|nr:hypothetical protein [Roseomonas sp. GC11]MCQ4162063.1 hypothetical protein [Roseomonas sp. GC11]
MGCFRDVSCGLVLAALLAPLPARAADYTLGAAIGGAVPYATRESYVAATLLGERAGQVALTNTLPMQSLVKPVFDSRPVYALGARVSLGKFGKAQLSLDGQIAAGAEKAPDEPRPLLGLARLRVQF